MIIFSHYNFKSQDILPFLVHLVLDMNLHMKSQFIKLMRRAADAVWLSASVIVIFASQIFFKRSC